MEGLRGECPDCGIKVRLIPVFGLRADPDTYVPAAHRCLKSHSPLTQKLFEEQARLVEKLEAKRG